MRFQKKSEHGATAPMPPPSLRYLKIFFKYVVFWPWLLSLSFLFSLFFTVSLLVYFSCSTMGYSKKKKKNWGHTSSLRNPLKFLAILLTFSCSGQGFIPGISAMQSCISYTPWKFQNQKPRPLEILFFFLKPPEIPRLF